MKELMERFFVMVNYLKNKEEGQGLAEYALILVLVAIVCVAALIFLGGSINNVLSNVGANIASQPGGGGS
jgi:pilus assembly protein Flp/PilA